MSVCPVVIVSALSMAASADIAVGQDIYKWQDADGTTHYSEVPPPIEFSTFEVLDVEEVQSNDPEPGDYRAALEMANSLERGRLKREKLRLEQDRLAQQEREMRLESQRYYQTYRTPYNDSYYLYSYPGYVRPPHYRPGPPGYRPPGQRPPGQRPPRGSVQKRVYVGR